MRQKRAKSEQAIQLAMKNRWDEAAQLNREILDLFPRDIDAQNRLGKALMELGRYAESREAYGAAVKIDPMNGIATKNLQRLEKLIEEGAAAPPPTAVDPRLFIEESGKTTVTQLTDIRRSDAVAKLTAGDQLRLDPRGKQVMVLDSSGNEIGRVEPKLEQTLVRLLQMKNQYAVFVTASSEHSVNVIIRETSRSAEMGHRPSFRPAAAPEGAARAYTREGFRFSDADEEDEDDGDDDDEVEADATPAEADAVEETPIEALAAAEEEEPEEAS